MCQSRLLHFSSLYIFQILLTNLTTNAWYTIQIRAATASLYHKDQVYKGLASLPQKIHLRLNCDTIRAFTVLEADSNADGVGGGDVKDRFNLASASGGGAGGDLQDSAAASSSEGMIDLGTGIIAGFGLVAMVLILTIVAFPTKGKRYILRKFPYIFLYLEK